MYIIIYKKRNKKGAKAPLKMVINYIKKYFKNLAF
jgi:hypothetical protein